MSDEPMRTDVGIIGAGPVGLFAVFECGMLDIRCHVIDSLEQVGGQCTALYPEKPIYDIPGYPRILAGDLIAKLRQQAEPFQPVYHLAQQVSKLVPTAGGRWLMETSAGRRVDAAAVMIAAGVGAFRPNRPPLAGIERLERLPQGSGVQYLVTDVERYRGRRIVIAGGGDSAIDWALALAPVAKRIFLVHRRAKFRAAPDSVQKLRRLADSDGLDLVIPFQLHALETAADGLQAVIVSDLDGNIRRLEADVLLPFFGLSQDLGPIAEWGLNLHHNHIVVDPATGGTNQPGLFAIGDVATYPGKLKLILSGFAEAAAAAHAIHPIVHPGEALHFEYSTTKGVPGPA
jgi:thioredoxin reductase (NADPH)